MAKSNSNNKKNHNNGQGRTQGPYCKLCKKNTNHTTGECDKRKCTHCNNTGHSIHECLQRPLCTYCDKRGHALADCKKKVPRGPVDLDFNMGDAPGLFTSELFNPIHTHDNFQIYQTKNTYSQKSKAAQQEAQAQMPIQPPVSPESIWCRFCNSRSHNSASCDNDTQKVIIDHMPELPMNYCRRCEYKGHSSQICLNPYPSAVCLTCGVKGHVLENCLQNHEPGSIKRHKIQLLKKKDDDKKDSKKSGFKRRRDSYTDDFVKAHCEALSIKNQDRVETINVPANYLQNVSQLVLAPNQPRDRYNTMWAGIDLSLTIQKIRDHFFQNGFTFYRIIQAIQFLSGGWTIHCGHEGCQAACAIVDQDLNPISTQQSTNSYTYSNPSAIEHPVFLACSCSHMGWERTMVWRKVVPQQNKAIETYQTRIKRVRKYAEDPHFKRIMMTYLSDDTDDSDAGDKD